MKLATHVVVLTAIARIAIAEPAPRLVLADRDPQLRSAVEIALRPWHVEIVDDSSPPKDAGERAFTADARYVVWRDHGELVVYDRADGRQLRTAVRDGALDPVSAAAAALTIKTTLRLPPLEANAPPPPPPPLPTPSAPATLELDTRFGGGGRLASGAAGWISANEVVRLPEFGLGIGVGVDIANGASVDQAGFKGTWSEQTLTAFASLRFPIGPIELEPWLGVGAVRSALSGAEMNVARDERATLFAVRGGAWAWWRWDRFRVGGGLAIDDTFGTPTYTKLGQTRAVVFEVPSFGVVGGVAGEVAFEL